MIDRLLQILEGYEKEYNKREAEYPCKYYAGRADAYREIWDIVANMTERKNEMNVYRQYEQIKKAVSEASLPPDKYEQIIKAIAEILGI